MRPSDFSISTDYLGRPCISGTTWITAPDWDADEAERQGRDLLRLADELRRIEASDD